MASNSCRFGRTAFLFTTRKNFRHISVFPICQKFCHSCNNIILFQSVDLPLKWGLSVGISIALFEEYCCHHKTGHSKISRKIKRFSGDRMHPFGQDLHRMRCGPQVNRNERCKIKYGRPKGDGYSLALWNGSALGTRTFKRASGFHYLVHRPVSRRKIHLGGCHRKGFV